MRLPFFRASKPATEPTTEPTRPLRGKTATAADPLNAALGLSADGPLQAARTRARRRLIGAAVLVAVGVLGFPVLFETRPRPLPVDTPMVLPEGAGRKASGTSALPFQPKPPPDAGLEAGPSGQAATVPSSAPTSTPMTAPVIAPMTAPVTAPAAVKAPASAAKRVEATAPAAPASRPALAKPPAVAAQEAAPATGRFVVQVGAYNDAERLRAARQNVERLGFKSYTQDVETSTGKRTRVRLGPFPTRKEAEAVADKVKASGLQANILAL